MSPVSEISGKSFCENICIEIALKNWCANISEFSSIQGYDFDGITDNFSFDFALKRSYQMRLSYWQQ